MHNALAVIAGLIAIFATLPYIRNTLKGKTRPNVVTWFTWSLLNGITAVAAFAGGAKQTAIFAGAVGLCTTLVVIAGLKHGIKKYTTFDIVCQGLAIAGIILWQLTGVPALAILFTITSSFIGSLPTLRHSWRAPQEETWQYYAIDAFSGLLAVAAISHFNFVSLAYPAYIAASDASIAAVILHRLPHRTP